MRERTHWLILLPISTALLGCPSPVEHKYGVAEKKPPPAVGEDDPRVAKDGEDLYPADVVERAEAKKRPTEEPETGRGSGKPDESNGVCRLYAPKLPKPECCKPEFGFDVETARQACGLEMYLGESWQQTCGYYFQKPDGDSTWFRASFINGKTAKEAADSQANQLRTRLKADDIEVQKVPGSTDAYWMTYQGLGWAYMGGWPSVRQFAWKQDACNEDGLAQVIAKMEGAKVPPENAKRLGLVPKARE
jgi:hypothetical protein